MAKKLDSSKSRTVVEPISNFDLSTSPLSSLSLSSFTCIAISNQQSNPQNLLIYGGTNSGALLLLTLNPNTNDSSSTTIDDGDGKEIKLIRSVSISRSCVDSIHVVAEIGRVLVLSEGCLYLVDLELLHPVKRLGVLKGVKFVARRSVCSADCRRCDWVYEENAGSSGVGGRIMRKLSGGGVGVGGVKSNGVKVRELGDSSGVGSNAGDVCLFVVAVGKKVLFIELNVGDGQHVSVVVLKEMPCVEGVKSIVWLDDSLILGTSSAYSVMSCVTGHVSLIFTLPDMGTSSPCLKLLSKDKKVLLVVDNAGIIVDRHGQPVGGTLVFGCAPNSIAELSSYVVVAGNGKMELYHKRSGACVQTLSLGGGVGKSSCFLADEEDANGRFVAVAASSKVFCYCKILSEEQIKDLLKKKNFKEAISLVEELELEGDMSKEMLSFVHAQVGFLLLFDLCFEEAVDHFLLSESMQPSEIFPFVIRDPNRWSLLVPRNRYWGLHPPPVHIEDVVEDGLSAIQRATFLKKAGVETSVRNEFLMNPPNRADLLESAFSNIIRYLQVMRNRELSQQVKEGVDTLLMYLYRILNCTEDMENLASSENCCVVEELESLLEESGHLRTLAFLYANKGMSSKALAIWRILARNSPPSVHLDSAETCNLSDSSSIPISSRQTAAIEASKILESADVESILHHLGWISEVNEELAVQVLTSQKRISPLPPDDVVAAIDPRKIQILQRYLQWLIEDQDSSDTQFHTLYALSLAKTALESMETDICQQVHGKSTRDPDNYNVQRKLPSENPVRERLQFFLHSSDLYDAEEVLDLIERSELWLEKAILYRKLGQETLVLQILALKLEDNEAAEQYCVELGRPDAFMQLLDMYLDPQNGKEPMFTAAVRLLHNHGESLDPLQVLERLSPDMPLQLASDTILRMLRARLHHYHQGKIVHSLSRAVDVDARLSRFDERARNVQINDESLCDSCHARLGTKLFAMYPDDSIVCYKCFRHLGESTSVTHRDFKKEPLIKPGWLVSR